VEEECAGNLMEVGETKDRIGANLEGKGVEFHQAERHVIW
jgi:hypothetical protein